MSGECALYECHHTCKTLHEGTEAFCPTPTVNDELCSQGCNCEPGQGFVRFDEKPTACRPIEYCPHNTCDNYYHWNYTVEGNYYNGSCQVYIYFFNSLVKNFSRTTMSVGMTPLAMLILGVITQLVVTNAGVM